MIWPAGQDHRPLVPKTQPGVYSKMPSLGLVLFIVLIVLPLLMLFAFGWMSVLTFWTTKVGQYSPFSGRGNDQKDENVTELGNMTNSNVSRPLNQLNSSDIDYLELNFNETQQLIDRLMADEKPEPVHRSCNGNHFYCESPSPWNNKTLLLPWTKRCDGVSDCWDQSDERNCTKCLTSFSCPSDDGKYLKCLKGDKLCNRVADCADKSDETLYCNRQSPCSANETSCKYQKGICFPESFRCDGERQCRYGNDEDDCEWCQGAARGCDKGGKYLMCVSIWDLCDGHSHCADHFDEKFFHCNSSQDCPGSCHLTTASDVEREKDYNRLMRRWSEVIMGSHDQIQCTDGKWYNPFYACSGEYPQCDEKCEKCSPMAFQCVDKQQCVTQAQYHDGVKDCIDGTDEANCTAPIPCTSRSKRCNGFADCEDGQDEANCTECANSYERPRYSWMYDYYDRYDDNEDKSKEWIEKKHKAYHCKADKKCIQIQKRCDGRPDCSDGQDEEDCSCAECFMHPFEMYMCRDSKRCFRYGEVCDEQFGSQCPNATRLDEEHCSLKQYKLTVLT